jgi:hypothetical protein
MKLFYEDKIEKAIELSNGQLQEGWTIEEIVSYWECLGYSTSFINQIKQQLVKK